MLPPKALADVIPVWEFCVTYRYAAVIAMALHELKTDSALINLSPFPLQDLETALCETESELPDLLQHCKWISL